MENRKEMLENGQAVVENTTVACPWINQPRPHQGDEEEVMSDDGDHPLLEDTSPGYSGSVIQRSLVSWMHLGQKNGFAKICGYYNRLEKVEDTYSPEQRAQSRQLEQEFMNEAPPTSEYFLQNWGHIYGRPAPEPPAQKNALERILEASQPPPPAARPQENLS